MQMEYSRKCFNMIEGEKASEAAAETWRLRGKKADSLSRES